MLDPHAYARSTERAMAGRTVVAIAAATALAADSAYARLWHAWPDD